MKIIKKLFLLLLIIAIIAVGCIAWILYGRITSNPYNYKTIGEIPTPYGYERFCGDNPSYSEYLRSLPLKGRGADVKLYTGSKARFQSLNYAVVNLPIISNAEQCADVCMRLRAEYLYNKGRFSDIHFLDVQGNTLSYNGGKTRDAFEKYLRKVFNVANTYSLCQEMKPRPLTEIQPGDVFVYPANSQRYGHAVMVADVAHNPETGSNAVVLVEGFMPARSIHVLRNWDDSHNSPWFILDETSDYQTFSLFQFNVTDLKCFQ